MSPRAFLAAALPTEAQRELGAWLTDHRAELDPAVRWVDPEAAHLTLKFLGDIPDERIDPLIEHCRAKVGADRAFGVELGGIGAFPSARKARVVWLGIAAGARELSRLARKLDATCAKFGVERERRPYRAHLTVGRLRQPRPLSLHNVDGPKGIAFRVEDVVFYESRLSPRGAHHIPLARLPLRTDEAWSEFAPES